jgi:acetyl-CoA decarbonylase/synthase complex subunit gamma
VFLLLAGYIGGAVLTPLLLPYLPGRAFSMKGAITGAALAALYLLIPWRYPGLFPSRLVAASWLCIIPAVTSFLAMNFTGSTPYTSLSGVRREIKIALPVQIFLSVTGLAMWLTGRFI